MPLSFKITIRIEYLHPMIFAVSNVDDTPIIDRDGVLRWADIANRDVEKAIKILLKEKDKTE